MKNTIAYKWANISTPILIILFFFCIAPFNTKCQDLDTFKLNEFFNSLEGRNEAMGSIVIVKDGQLLYSKAIGYRHISADGKANEPANVDTKYRIWSITKTFTAVMILQLVEEGRLTLATTLDAYFPEIKNSDQITIKQMLAHKSGIKDFTHIDDSEEKEKGDSTSFQEKMIARISAAPAEFNPGEDMRYSNSNFLLLGFMIEQLDGSSYGVSLANRISSKVGLTNTFYGTSVVDRIENKSYTYSFDGKWEEVEEGDFSALIPGAAGSIVATPIDLAKFMTALHSGKLISKQSLNHLLQEDLGSFKMPYKELKGYGHTGGYIASESSLVHYPSEGLTIAYCTNGIVYPKEKILEGVLRIYFKQPFAVSMSRTKLALIILPLGFLLLLGLFFKKRTIFNSRKLLPLGIFISSLFWISNFIAGLLQGDYDPIKSGVNQLDEFYAISGTFMASVEWICALLILPFMISLFFHCKKHQISFIPILFLIFVAISFFGLPFFSTPDSTRAVFGNIIIPVALGPLLAVFLWRKKEERKLRLVSLLSFVIMATSLGVIIMRPSFPGFVYNYFGLILSLFHVGWTLWLLCLGGLFMKIQK